MNDHGSITFYSHQRAYTFRLNTIKNTVTQMIMLGCVIQAEKTKAGRRDALNGKHWVTIGPYRTANETYTRYAMYVGIHPLIYLSPDQAAQDFIDWCGRRLAREAVRDFARKH